MFICSPLTIITFSSMMLACRNDFVDNKGCIQQASNMHGMYITMMKKLQVCVADKYLLLKETLDR